MIRRAAAAGSALTKKSIKDRKYKGKANVEDKAAEIEKVAEADIAESTSVFRKIINSNFFLITFNGAIFLNSIVLALPNYAEMNENGELLMNNSIRNTIFVNSQLVFLLLFSIELLLKVLAFGVVGENSYFVNNWNKLDTLVVVSGWISFGLPKGGHFITILRLLRVLRPLRSLSISQEIRKVIVVVIASVPGLANVLVITGFAFLFFSIAGLQGFMGPDMHSRCRLTPFPVNLSWTTGKPFKEYQCLNAENIDVASKYPEMIKSSSPWAIPLSNCYWPMDTSNHAFCALSSPDGLNVCLHDTRIIPESAWTWCGSNYDGFGNRRFADHVLMEEPDYIPSLFWGHLNFDNIFKAFLTVVVIVCLNPWTEIMYMMQDTFGRHTAVYFIVLILIGTYIVLNLILTSINDTVMAYKTGKLDAQLNEALHDDDDGGDANAAGAEEIMTADKSIDPPIPKQLWVTLTGLVDWRVGLLEPVVNHPIFKYSSLILIFTAIVLLSMNFYRDILDSSPTFRDNLEGIYFVLVLIFFVELLLTLAANGLRKSFTNSLIVVDFVVVMLSFIEACQFPPPIISGSVHADRFLRRDFGMGLLAWRAPRVVQFIVDYFGVTRVTVFFGRILKAILDCLAFCVVFALFIYMFALVGMQSFANKLRFDEAGYVIPVTDREAWLNAFERPRSNFDDFFLAVGTVFQIVTAEKWYVVMNDLWRSEGSVGVTYVIVTLVLGQYVLLNQLLTLIIADIVYHGGDSVSAKETSSTGVEVPDEGADNRNGSTVSTGNSRTEYVRDTYLARRAQHLGFFSDDESFSASASQLQDVWMTQGASGQHSAVPQDEESQYEREKEGGSKRRKDSTKSAGSSLCRCTDLCKAVHESVWFNALSGSMALLSAIQLAIASPLLNPNSPFGQAMLALNIIFTVYICIENIIDVVGEGPSKFFLSAWNCADTAVTLISVIGLCISNDAMISIRVLKALRTLTAMGRLPGFSGLTNTTKAMIDVIPKTASVFMYFMGVLFLFSIFMVSSFSGQLRSCHGRSYEHVVRRNPDFYSALMSPLPWDSMGQNSKELFGPESAVFTYYGMAAQAQEACGSGWPAKPCCFNRDTETPEIGEHLAGTSKSYCECWGGAWESDSERLFDNVAQGMLSLFQISMLDGWAETKDPVTDATGLQMQPIRDIKSSWIFFFIFFIVVTNFLFLNLFISEVVKSFNANLPEPDVPHNGLMDRFDTVEYTWTAMFDDDGTDEAVKLEASKRLLKSWELPRAEKQWTSGKNPFHMFAQSLANDPYFEQFSMWLIIFNCITLAMPYFGASDEYMRGIDKANTAFGVLFNVELLVHLAARGPYFFNEALNCFDAVIVLGTDAQMISAIFTAKATSKVVSLGRMLRLLKVVRMLRLPQLQRLMTVLYSFLPNIRNIGVFLFFMVGIFAVIGMHSFGKTAFFGLYDEYANFRSIDVSLLTMFRFLTGQAWDTFMNNAAKRESGCVVNPPYNALYCGFSDHLGCIPLNGCGSGGIFPFMLVYMLGVSICCLSLFVAVIIDGLTLYAEDTVFDKIDRSIRDDFAACWRKYDKEGTGFISVRNLEKLVVDADNPYKLFVGLKRMSTVDVLRSWGGKCCGIDSGEDSVLDPKDPGYARKLVQLQKERRKALEKAIDTLPFTAKMRKGCLFSDVFKVLFLSADSQLVALSENWRMEIETRSVLPRQWLSLKEYYAARVIWTWCSRLLKKRRVDKALVLGSSMLKVFSDVGIETLNAVSEMPRSFSESMARSFSDAFTSIGVGVGSGGGGGVAVARESRTR